MKANSTISWDEALDTIASSLKKTVEQYGNEAVYIQYSSGIVGGNMTRSSPSASAVKRLMNCVTAVHSISMAPTAPRKFPVPCPTPTAVMMATAPRILKTASWS
ncbi:molybdopterin-dependent oxidoreductase [Escherichia coli]